MDENNHDGDHGESSLVMTIGLLSLLWETSLRSAELDPGEARRQQLPLQQQPQLQPPLLQPPLLQPQPPQPLQLLLRLQPQPQVVGTMATTETIIIS